MSIGPEALVRMLDETRLDYNTKLNFQGLNAHNARIYKDNQGRYVVKVEDHPSEDEPSVMANYQGDRYMGTEGTIYLITPSYEDMDSHGVILQSRALSEPPMNPRGLDRSLARPTRSLDYLPSAPPMPMHYSTPIEP